MPLSNETSMLIVIPPQRLSIDSQSYDDDEFTDLDSSAAPARGDRGKLMRSMTKQSVTDLLKNVKSPDIT